MLEERTRGAEAKAADLVSFRSLSVSRAYVEAMRQHLAEQTATLDELSMIASRYPLQKIERLAVERCIHLLVESAISVARNCLNKAAVQSPNDAYGVLLRAQDLLAIPVMGHSVLHEAVAIRHAIVRDYLDLDWSRIEDLLVDRQYKGITVFVEAWLNYLAAD